jgi:predicted nucleic acid-binding protein
LDTNHIGEAIGRVSTVRDRLQQMHRQGFVFGTCGPVLCELLVGAVLRRDAAKARMRLNILLQVVRVWPIDLTIAEHYAGAYHEIQRAGRALSQVDLMLAALARHFDATLLSTDRDFEALGGIRLENWLAKQT